MKEQRLKVTKKCTISVPDVLTVTWFNLDLQKLVCEVISADALFPGNVFFTYTQIYEFNDGS